MHNVPEWMLVVIIVEYVIIAGQFLVALRRVSGKAKRALIFLLAIFVLCSIAGYMTGLVNFPSWLAVIVHGALIIAGGFYIHLRQANEIAKALE